MIFPAHPTCRLCSLHTEANSVGIPTTYVPDSLLPGPDVPSVMFIGQGPGIEEDRQNAPHVGASGKFLHDVYIDGLHLRERASIYLQNGVRCGPHAEKNIGPYNKCLPYLLEDIITICEVHAPCPPRLMFISAIALRAFLRATTDESNVNQQQSFGMQGKIIKIKDLPGPSWSAFFFSCENPIVPMLHNPPSIRTVNDHLRILSRHLDTNKVATTTEPTIVEPRMPES